MYLSILFDIKSKLAASISFSLFSNLIEVLKEGYYWLDRQIIKAIDTEGNIHKIARLHTDDKLNIVLKGYKPEDDFKIESWFKTSIRLENRLKEIEAASLDLISKSIDKYKDYEPIILTSGGKDSSVILHLVRKHDENTKGIFSNTSLDCADTYKHIKTVDNIEIINPPEGFYQWRKRLDFIPARFARACCTLFKEGAMMTKLDKTAKYLFFMGMRNEESSGRSGYGDEWRNEKWDKREWEGILPIRTWKELDIWLYILSEGIEINGKYKKGYGRVGCSIACPYYHKSIWTLDKYWYPTMYNRWQNILKEDFLKHCKWTRMNCTLEEYYTNWNGGLVREEPTEEVIMEFAEYKGIDIEMARKYFGNNCSECSRKVFKKDDVAMNLKLLGRNSEKIMCKKCLMKFLDIDKKKWNEYIEDFKKSGCDLF